MPEANQGDIPAPVPHHIRKAMWGHVHALEYKRQRICPSGDTYLSAKYLGDIIQGICSLMGIPLPIVASPEDEHKGTPPKTGAERDEWERPDPLPPEHP